MYQVVYPEEFKTNNFFRSFSSYTTHQLAPASRPPTQHTRVPLIGRRKIQFTSASNGFRCSQHIEESEINSRRFDVHNFDIWLAAKTFVDFEWSEHRSNCCLHSKMPCALVQREQKLYSVYRLPLQQQFSQRRTKFQQNLTRKWFPSLCTCTHIVHIHSVAHI